MRPNSQGLQADIVTRDATIEAAKLKMDELSARILELESTVEKLQTDKAAQDEELKSLVVCDINQRFNFN